MGSTVRAQGMMYKAVVQLVLLYGSESWVVTRAMVKVLEGFHKLGSKNYYGYGGEVYN